MAPGGSVSGRCRLCTANDPDALAEHLAEQLWEGRRHGTLDDVPWAECGSYWQDIFRDHARLFIQAARG